MSQLDKNYMQEAARIIESKLPDNHGFILLVAPYGDDPSQRLFYVSTMDRACAINVLKEWLIKASGEEEWMKHLK